MATVDRRGLTVGDTSPAVGSSDPSANLAIKTPVRVATTANITLTSLQTIDGVSVVADDRVLVKNQTDATQNGIYLVSSGNWARTSDFDSIHEAVKGTVTFVNEGTTNQGTAWKVSASDPIVPDTTSLSFAIHAPVTGAVTIGLTTLSGGTTKGLLYNNGGVFGNLSSAISGVLTTDSSGIPSITTNLTISGGIALNASNSGAGTISANKDQNGTSLWFLQNQHTGTAALAAISLINSNGAMQIGVGGVNYSPSGGMFTNRGLLVSAQNLSGIVIGAGATSGSNNPIIFALNTATESGRFLETQVGAFRLGVAGASIGTVLFGNMTSGYMSIAPATGALGTGVATLPTGTYNIVGDTLTQTLTNKTLTAPVLNNPAISGTNATTNNQDAASTVSLTNTSAGTGAAASFNLSNGSNSFNFTMNGVNKTASGFLLSNTAYAGATSDFNLYSLAGKIGFAANGVTEQMRLATSGGLVVGNGIIGTDPGAGSVAGAGGLQTAPPTTKTNNYTQLITDYSLIFNGAGSLALTLLAAGTYPGRQLLIKTIAAQTVVSNASNVVPLAGGAAGTAILAATAGKWALLVSNGTAWEIMASN